MSTQGEHIRNDSISLRLVLAVRFLRGPQKKGAVACTRLAIASISVLVGLSVPQSHDSRASGISAPDQVPSKSVSVPVAAARPKMSQALMEL